MTSDTYEFVLRLHDVSMYAHTRTNIGVAGSQAYTRLFGNLPPSLVPDNLAYTWLSRGLVEGLSAFITQVQACSDSSNLLDTPITSDFMEPKGLFQVLCLPYITDIWGFQCRGFQCASTPARV